MLLTNRRHLLRLFAFYVSISICSDTKAIDLAQYVAVDCSSNEQIFRSEAISTALTPELKMLFGNEAELSPSSATVNGSVYSSSEENLLSLTDSANDVRLAAGVVGGIVRTTIVVNRKAFCSSTTQISLIISAKTRDRNELLVMKILPGKSQQTTYFGQGQSDVKSLIADKYSNELDYFFGSDTKWLSDYEAQMSSGDERLASSSGAEQRKGFVGFARFLVKNSACIRQANEVYQLSIEAVDSENTENPSSFVKISCGNSLSYVIFSVNDRDTTRRLTFARIVVIDLGRIY